MGGRSFGIKVDIAGQRFGKLVGIMPTDGRDDSGSIIWKMKCDCGNDHFISVRLLRYRGTKTCGKCPLVRYETKGDVTFGWFVDGSKFTIDSKDYKKVSKHSWSRSGNGYIHSFIKGKYVYLHHFLIGVTAPGVYVDHINRDKWDNRRKNLRTTNGTGNGLNKHISKGGKTSKYRGVCWDKSKNKWRAGIAVGKRFYLGRFDVEEDAAMVYNYAANLLAPGYIEPNDVPEAPPHIKKYVYEKCKDYLFGKDSKVHIA